MEKQEQAASSAGHCYSWKRCFIIKVQRNVKMLYAHICCCITSNLVIFVRPGNLCIKRPSFVSQVHTSCSSLHPYVMKFVDRESQTKTLLSKTNPTPTFTPGPCLTCARRQALGIEAKCSRYRKTNTTMLPQPDQYRKCGANQRQVGNKRHAVQDANCPLSR